ncbi:MAG: M24 family metallopeptidase [Actinobacteria bacterium]|nr:MAG: M24 family metallopeptidase [Actinomycetota bacterium]
MNAVDFGVIGLGGAWSFHGNATAASPMIRFTAMYDVNYRHALKMSRRYRAGPVTVYKDLEGFLGSDIHAVLVTVPHAYHEETVSLCAAAGKHVLCEKPMATTLEGCDAMIEATRKAGVRFMVAENHRFLPAHRYIHDAIREGLIGEVLLVRAYEGVNEIAGLSQPDSWKGDINKAGGGSFMDMGAHKFATLEWILQDRVEEVTAMLSRQAVSHPEKGEDNALSMIRFSRGTIGEVVVSFTQQTTPFNSLEIYGTQGTILENHAWERPVRIYSYHKAMGDHRREWYEPELEHAPFPHYYTISVRHEDEHFAGCILEDREPEFSPDDAKSAVACVLMGYLSAGTGRAATRGELVELAEKEGTGSLYQDLGEHIPARPGLPEVKRMKPIGFDRERAEEIMNGQDLDLLVATSPINVYYLSGLPTLPTAPNPILFALRNMYPNVVLMRRDGHLALFHWALFRSVDEFCWANEYKGIIGQREAKRAVWSKLKRWGFRGRRVGVESSAPKWLVEHLSSKDPELEVVTADQAFLDLRVVKSEEEITLIEKATAVTEKAITACMEAAAAGISDNDFLKLGKQTMLAEGADGWDHLTLSIGGSDPEAPGLGTVAEQGDILRFDFGAVCKGYVSDVNRHLVLGPVPPEAEELVGSLIQLQEFYEQHVKPGVNMRELNEEAIAYYKSLRPEGLTFVVGHSIGLECEEQHLFGTMGVAEGVFKENMVFEIEAWEPFRDTLIGVEDCYVVTGDGCRRITTLDKRITGRDGA